MYYPTITHAVTKQVVWQGNEPYADKLDAYARALATFQHYGAAASAQLVPGATSISIKLSSDKACFELNPLVAQVA